MQNNSTSKNIMSLRENTCTFSLDDGVKDCSDDSKFQFYTKCLHNRVFILYPSFCTPLIIKPSDNIWLTIVTDEGFYKAYSNAPDIDIDKEVAGIQICRMINTLLKFTEWGTKEIKDAPLFDSNEKAEKFISCYYMGQLSDAKIFSKMGLMPDEGLKLYKREVDEKKFFSTMRSSIKNYCVKNGLQYIFQINIISEDILGNSEDSKMYNISWIVPEVIEKNKPPVFCELQDLFIQNFVKVNREQDESTDKNNLLYAYNIEKLSNENVFELSFDNPVQSFHPVYVTNKTYLDIGHLTDVHVSSRQHAFQKSKARVLFGETTKDISPEIGDMVNVSFHNLKKLMDEFGKSVDILIITGDIYDFLINLDLTTVETDMDVVSNLWDLFNIKDKNNLKKRYVKGIDFITIYSLFKYFYDTYKKPILFVSGNHEAYNNPYGISPRIAGLKRANEGIPADHNLTIYEAILMFGKAYGDVTTTFGRRETKNFEWTYNLLTPLNNFCIEFSNQCFLGLEWGDKEEIFDKPLTGHGFGHLPRANKSINSTQYDLISTVAENKDKNIKILFSHFTYVNYALDLKITEEGKVHTLDLNKHTIASLNLPFNKYNHGTFEINIDKVFKCIANNTFRYIISGHSHRAGLYRIIDQGYFFPYKCIGFDPYSNKQPEKIAQFEGNKTRILVSPSGGPIPVQNYNHELKTFSLASPSGTAIKFDGNGNDSLEPVYTVQPRFAVALDYFDILKNGFLNFENVESGVFKFFRSDKSEHEFTLEFHEDLNLPTWNFVKQIVFTVQLWEKNFESFYYSNFNSNKNTITIVLGKKVFHKLLIYNQIFITFLFNNNLKSFDSFKQYNFSSPWNFPIKIIKNFTIVGDIYVELPGFIILRNPSHGEIPDLEWYEDFL